MCFRQQRWDPLRRQHQITTRRILAVSSFSTATHWIPHAQPPLLFPFLPFLWPIFQMVNGNFSFPFLFLTFLLSSSSLFIYFNLEISLDVWLHDTHVNMLSTFPHSYNAFIFYFFVFIRVLAFK